MTYYTKHAELYHHGVKGMKWGVRRGKKPTGKGRARRGEKAQDASAKEARKQKFKKVAKYGATVAGGLLAAGAAGAGGAWLTYQYAPSQTTALIGYAGSAALATISACTVADAMSSAMKIGKYEER